MPLPARRGGPAHGRRARRGGRRHAGTRPRWPRSIVKLNEGVSGAGQRPGRPARPPRPGSRTSATAIRDAPARACSSESPSTSARGLPGEVRASAAGSSRSASPGGADAVPSVQLRVLPDGTVELLSTHDQLLGGPSGQSYLGCVFPADPATPRRSAGTRWSIGRHLADARGARPVRGRLRRRAGRDRRLDVVRDRAEPAQGRHHPPVPDPAVPHRRPLRRRTGRVPDARPGTRSTWSRPTTSSRRSARADASTTCSTSWPRTACTSTSPGRPGSCST